jgi:DNA-binding NarL/FixJ family response regulator
MSIRLVLVDENTLFRLGLSELLSSQEDFKVVSHVRTGKEAIQAAVSINPDLIVIDIALVGANGLEVVAQIKRRQPMVKVVMLTTFKTHDYVREALRAGADGYVLKDATLDELLMALRSVAKGKNYLSPDVSMHVVNSFLHPQSNGASASRLDALTWRERSVLQLIAEGRTNRSAAEFLSLSPKTVEKHRANLMHKLGLRSAVELTLVALELGLIERPFAVSRMTDESGGEEGFAA